MILSKIATSHVVSATDGTHYLCMARHALGPYLFIRGGSIQLREWYGMSHEYCSNCYQIYKFPRGVEPRLCRSQSNHIVHLIFTPFRRASLNNACLDTISIIIILFKKDCTIHVPSRLLCLAAWEERLVTVLTFSEPAAVQLLGLDLRIVDYVLL